jgi:putative glutamine amidotransferase
MSLEATYRAELPALGRRLRWMTGDAETTEDICQETFLRAWTRAPRDAPAPVLAAWLRRTATNLAVDELRRRARRPAAALDELAGATADGAAARDALVGAAPDGAAAREAFACLPVADRAVLALRFQAGLTLRELGAVLGIAEDAARKRVERARARLRAALDEQRADPLPLVLLLVREDAAEPYARWLEAAGARVRIHRHGVRERDVLFADALVVSGSLSDVHPAVYGEAPGPHLAGTPDARRDWRDLGALGSALAADLPVLGVCSGHQLLNVASGGTLHQHLRADAAHAGEEHAVHAHGRSRIRDALGARLRVRSDHHQGVRRVGARLRVTATSPDGLVEGIERADRRFAVGVQWRPQVAPGEPANRRLAETLVAAAVARR